MGLFSKKKSGRFHLAETNLDFGLMPYTVTVDPDAQMISFHLCGSKKTIHEIDFDKITECDAYISPVYEEKKAWMGRTIAGGLIAGKTGAIVGAATAGNKQTRKLQSHIDISFLGGVKYMKFVSDPDSPSASGVAGALFKIFNKSPNQTLLRGF